ncbi:hypothetical protein MTY66_61990 (plasmid) [Mycolicibacterium sp. TY66]|uniref:hypothetical protein n=1 Tax=unclassified Mycolicibacterium TaxID=2636767 RepID=UPI001BB3C542|nr:MULTISPECIES: hypothetical protein [unclassified Mycolicibacterium]BCI84574.1 hypothetical protein MTY66_61990 [Mycolicibacterium sp. TY66]BCJ84804.1 hypothetical protein MTY81_61770 [Mycolicibacterium sp. TY81]
MRPEDAIATLQQAGSKAARNRDRRANEAEREGLELGAIGNLLKTNYGQSQSKTAAKLGIPQTTLSGWMLKAAEAGYTIEDPIYRALILGHGRIGQHVADNNIHIDRIVTTRGDTQMLAMTNLPIDAFSDGRHVDVPLMMAHNADTGEWIGVDNVLPGAYGGTGPSNVYRAAEELGLDDNLAREIAYTDECSDVDVFNGTATHPRVNTSAYPYPLPNPHPDNPAVFVQDFACNALDEWVHGRDDKSTTLSYAIYLRSWLKFFTHPEPPSWAQGPLRARIYIAPEAAAADGFGRPGWYGSDAVCQLILERGRTQLWLSLRQAHDPARWVSDEAYDLLAAIDHFPKEFEAEKDAPSMLRRWIRARTPERVRPPYLDVGPGGEPDRHGLDFIPARHKTTY